MRVSFYVRQYALYDFMYDNMPFDFMYDNIAYMISCMTHESVLTLVFASIKITTTTTTCFKSIKL